MDLSKLTVDDARNISYVDFVSILNETNKPPGGKDTIRRIAINSFLTKESSVLEIGCNTGFSSIELSSLIKCKVTGIDMNENAINAAKINAKSHLVDNDVSFSIGNAESLDYDSDAFDLIMCGGALAWVNNKRIAIGECTRVLKQWGFLTMVPFYYSTPPPPSLVDELNMALSSNIQIWDKNYWLDFVRNESDLEFYLIEDKTIEHVSKDKIIDFVNGLLSPYKSSLSKAVFEVLQEKGNYFFSLFNENHRYLSYSIFLLRKRPIREQLVLF
ncbi:MAG TPA: class I SAM-dependent methyltransferase [Legionellaceae bacterium]|nr:class I SAM-dependent methyltransferase [Legionellaceae bacterium]